MEITAKEIERQATRLEEEAANFKRACNSVINRLMSMKNILKSDDSRLSTKVAEFESSYVHLHATLDRKFLKLAEIMHKYARETIAAEEEMEQVVAEDVAAIENIEQAVANSGISFD